MQAGALFGAQREEQLDVRRLGGPLQQRGRVHRALVGRADAEPGGGEPVERGGPGEHLSGQPPPAAVGRLDVEQRLGDPAACAAAQRRVEQPGTEYVEHQVPPVDRLDPGQQRPGETESPRSAVS